MKAETGHILAGRHVPGPQTCGRDKTNHCDMYLVKQLRENLIFLLGCFFFLAAHCLTERGSLLLRRCWLS